MATSSRRSQWLRFLLVAAALVAFFVTGSEASVGDRLPEFKECVKVCRDTNCVEGNAALPLHLRLLLWDCPTECDYTCQHIITDQRLAQVPPHPRPIVQYHGKWPFYRVFGCQEIFSSLFSIANFLAHKYGMDRIRTSIPKAYPLRKYYLTFGYFGLASWTFSTIFHMRDLSVTEKLDYFGAGASVMYGMYLAVVRIYRLELDDELYKPSLRRFWTGLCATLYLAHVAYLSLWKFDYTYNMAANVIIGLLHNVLWTWYSYSRYRQEYQAWTAWPGLIVTWVVMAMSLELLDFPPFMELIDAHSLWHLATVVPTLWWYKFLIRDAQDDIAGQRLKA